MNFRAKVWFIDRNLRICHKHGLAIGARHRCDEEIDQFTKIIEDDRLFQLQEHETIRIESIIRKIIQETSSIKQKLPLAGKGLCK